MSNWIGQARTNYVTVRDLQAVTQICKHLLLDVMSGSGEDAGKVAFCPSRNSDDGGWPSRVPADGDDAHPLNGHAGVSPCDDDPEVFEVDVAEALAAHLADGEVLVLQEIGFERDRYVTGHAAAINSKGDYVRLNLNDVYELAAEKFGVPKLQITRASY